MDVYTWVIFMYVAGTLIIGWFLLHEITPSYKSKEKFVAPSYWGIYHDTAMNEIAREKTIRLHEIDVDPEGIMRASSNSYASGGTAKSVGL